MKEIRNRNALMANHKIHTAQKYLPRGGKIDLMQNKWFIVNVIFIIEELMHNVCMGAPQYMYVEQLNIKKYFFSCLFLKV